MKAEHHIRTNSMFASSKDTIGAFLTINEVRKRESATYAKCSRKRTANLNMLHDAGSTSGNVDNPRK